MVKILNLKQPALIPPSKELLARAAAVQRALNKYFPDVKCALDFKTPWQLLVATIMSAQCTDVAVNKATPALFKKYRTVQDFANADLEDLKQHMKSITFYNNKAANVQKSAKIIVEKFGGNVPKTMEELLTLPGVARKTANVVLGSAYGIASGIVVDTHMIRCSQRLGLTKNTDPVKIERDLQQLIPQKNWINFAHQMVWFGRKICTARSMACAEYPEWSKLCREV
jgi:endonuclease-3